MEAHTLGVPSAGGSADGDPTLNFRRWYQAYYIEDSFQVNKRLNVNGGVRYEYSQPPVDTRNHVGSFDLATGTSLTYPDTKALGLSREMVHPRYSNVSPRLGFNFLPFAGGNTVVKGGFGLYYLQPNLNQFEVEVDTPKYYSVNFYNNSAAGQPLAFTADELFNPALAGTSPGSGQSVSFINPNNVTPYSYEWSLGVQQTFLKHWLLDVTYLGSAAHHFEQRIISNPLLPNDTTRFPLYPGGAQENLNEGSSIYDGITARVEKRYASGFSFLGAYTFSRCLSDPWQDQFSWHPLDTKLDRGHCADDLNHRLSLNSIYELPFGQGKNFLNQGGLFNEAVGGWQVSAIASFYTGPWLTLSSNQNLGNFINTLPNVSGAVNDASASQGLGKNGKVGPYFSVQNVEAVTTLGVQGNAGVANIRSPGAQDWDLALFKNFKLTERYNLAFRTDFFNAFNHLEQAHQRWPSNHSVAASLARRYWLVGQPAQAGEALASVSITPATPLQELELRADVYLAVHSLAPAQAAAEAAYRKSPSTDTLLLLANIIQTQGRAHDALTLLESRRNEKAASAPFLITIAETEFDSELYVAAHRDLVEATALDPDSYQAHYLFGNTLVQQTKAEEAVSEYGKAIQIAPDKPRTFHQLALAQVILGDVNGARQSLQQCVAADPRYAPAYTEIGKLLLQQGRYEEAVEPLQKAVEYAPTQGFPYYFLTRVYARLGEKQQSDEMLDRYKAVKTANRKRPTRAESDDSPMAGQNTFSGLPHTPEPKP